jgi:nucleoid-associated protein YgaU
MSTSGPGGGPPQKPKADFSNVQSSHSSTAPAPAAAPAEKIHVVEKGESLSKIAQKYYGKASLWTKIHEANKDQIKNPDLIKPGQKLRIPAL